MKTIVEGVFSGHLPWRLVLSGGGAAICGMLLGANGLAFGIGVYLPLSTIDAHGSVGGCVPRSSICTRRDRPVGESDAGVLAASGLVAGEGLAGVVVAGLVAVHLVNKDHKVFLDGWIAKAAVGFIALLICGFLWRACRAKSDTHD